MTAPRGTTEHACIRCGTPVLIAGWTDQPVRCPACLTGRYVDIVFNGPPADRPAEFVEVEDADRRSIRYGEWVERDDGYWVLRIPRADR